MSRKEKQIAKLLQGVIAYSCNRNRNPIECPTESYTESINTIKLSSNNQQHTIEVDLYVTKGYDDLLTCTAETYEIEDIYNLFDKAIEDLQKEKESIQKLIKTVK